MNLASYKKKHGRSAITNLANRIDTPRNYLYQIASGARRAGIKLCMKLQAGTNGEVTAIDERPDIFGLIETGETKKEGKAPNATEAQTKENQEIHSTHNGRGHAPLSKGVGNNKGIAVSDDLRSDTGNDT